MPATGIRCLMTIHDDLYSINELHVSTSTDFTTTKARFIALFKLRMALCGQPAEPFRGRMSLVGARRVIDKLSALDISTINLTPAKAPMADATGNIGFNTSDQPKSCVLCNAIAGSGKVKNVYLAGIPDPVISEDPRAPGATFVPAYAPLFNAYAAELTSGRWGFVSRVDDVAVTKPKVITSLVISGTTGAVGVVITTGGDVYTVGQRVAAMGVRMTAAGLKTYGGLHYIESIQLDVPATGQATIYLRGTAGVPINQVQLLGRLEYVDFTTRTYEQFFPVSATTRKRGNRSLVGPGRRTNRNKVSL